MEGKGWLWSPWKRLAFAVGAFRCIGCTRLTQDTVLAGLQGSATGLLPTGHTLLGTELEDHPINSLKVQAQLAL